MQPIPPLPASVCPLCGLANHCNIVRGGIVEDCWCYKQKLNVAILERVTPTEHNQACICLQCAAVPAAQPNSK